MKKSWEKNKFLLVILTLVFLLRLPSFFDPYSYGDEGIYLTLGEGIRQGLTLYREIHDNKPPLLYLLAAISGSLFWFRFFLLAANLTTIYLFSLLAKILFPAKVKVQKTALVIFALLSTLPLIEGNIANAEIFMILPIIGAIILFFKQKPSLKSYLFIGILFSLATLFKIPAAFDFAALFVFLVFFKTERKFLQRLKDSVILAFAFFLPILATFIYFWRQNAATYYFTAAFAQNLPYLSSWGGQAKSAVPNPGLLIRALLVLGLSAGLWLKQKTINRPLIFVSVWFAFSIFATLLSGRPYPHYLIQVLPSFAFLAAIFLSKPQAREKFLSLLLLGVLFFSIIYFRFWGYPVFSYYQNFLAFAFGQKTQTEYFQNFSSKVPQTYELAEFITTHTAPNEKVFIWGDSPVVYALSHRLPPGRYTASYHIIDFGAQEETIDILKKETPRFIINLNDENRPFSQLETLISQDYALFKNIHQAQIFHRLP